MQRFFILIFVLVTVVACAAPPSNATPVALASNTPEIHVTQTKAVTETPTPTEAPRFTIDSLNLSPEQAKAVKSHIGLENSISLEKDGKFTAPVTFLATESQPVTKIVEVNPSTIQENVTSKNKYGNTPIMQTVDGQKIYWIQEDKSWFAVEISSDINKPVFIPFDQREVATRIVIAEFNQPFSQEALERWKTKSGISLGFQYLTVNANTGESTKFSFIENRSLTDTDVIAENSPVQLLDAWFQTTLSDGTAFTYFPTKWLDPMNPRDPKGDEWEIIFCASGLEVMEYCSKSSVTIGRCADYQNPGRFF